MSTALSFKKAVKREAKGRIALIGPAGAGKSYTMMQLARTLAGPNGKIAALDTEHGSLSKYADLFDFDVLELDSFTATNFLNALAAAENAGYSVFCCDSLSHFWVGKDGALEFVDMAAKRHKDNMGGWKEFRPHERAMVDAMIASPLHVICTMRTKTEYQEQVNPSTGKKQRVKIGLAPVQRDGLEYEFDLIGYMDEDNTLVVDKTRCPAYSQKAYTKPGPREFEPFVEWLKGAPADRTAPRGPQPVPPISPQAHTAPPPSAGGEGGGAAHPAPESTGDLALDFEKAFRMADRYQRLKLFADMKSKYQHLIGKDAGEIRYYDMLAGHGVQKSDQFKTLSEGLKCAKAMFADLLALEADSAQEPEPPAADPHEITDADLPEVLRG